ncbi:hypothetical protein RRG08_020693 [Elysia crispata]|uniref:Uncharacterized protein n=1 Tax=Elysia crispata TaxID=231223 RepID=A0AAE1DAC9_9GAST|nr:hypothetical protein RRG08_020693 [Elysia crispata]
MNKIFWTDSAPTSCQAIVPDTTEVEIFLRLTYSRDQLSLRVKIFPVLKGIIELRQIDKRTCKCASSLKSNVSRWKESILDLLDKDESTKASGVIKLCGIASRIHRHTVPGEIEETFGIEEIFLPRA